MICLFHCLFHRPLSLLPHKYTTHHLASHHIASHHDLIPISVKHFERLVVAVLFFLDGKVVLHDDGDVKKLAMAYTESMGYPVSLTSLDSRYSFRVGLPFRGWGNVLNAC